MSGWTMLLLILLALFLIGQLRVGVEGQYGEDGLQVRIRLGPVRLTVYPTKPKPEGQSKPKPKPKPKLRKKERPKQEKGKKLAREDLLELARQFVPLALEAAGCFWSKLVMDKLDIRIVVGSDDPADAALLYGQLHGALGAVWKPLNQAFHVKDGRGRVEVDFNSSSITLYFHGALSLKLGQLLWLGVHFGGKALAECLKFRKVQTRKAV